ncbi:MAG: hypothetical protein AB7G15_06750 [Alphaproteobacteria bacterium]
MRKFLMASSLIAVAACLPSISEAKFGQAMKGCIMDMYSNYSDLPYWGARPSGVVEGFYNACRNKGIPQV